MKNREIIEYVPRDGWERWRRQQRIKNVIVEASGWVFWLGLIALVAFKF